ncbi:MAG: polyketide cyclase [Acidobacteriota bacterium]|nr:polyketide cyclase [Acidobacteriota bacterium]
MAEDNISAKLVVDARAAEIFAVLAEPSRHAAIDGTGWVRQPLDAEVLTAPGQIFRMAMYHPNHPDGSYQMANRVQVLDPPRTISWEPGNEAPDGTLSVPGWVWRYDLTPAGPSQTTVTLTYDWSAVADPIRDRIGFPPFPPEHLDNSLAHLAELVAEQSAPPKS